MLVSTHSFLVVLLFLELHVQGLSEFTTCHFQKVKDDFLPTSNLTAILNGVISSADCAQQCTSRFRCQCRSYGYSRTSRVCRVYNVKHAVGDVTVPSAGTKYFGGCGALGGYGAPCVGSSDCDCLPNAMCLAGVCQCPALQVYDAQTRSCKTQTGIVGSSCGSGPECTVANTECRDGTCQCVIGYHFNPGPRTCVTTCAAYGSGYYRILHGYLDANNDLQSFANIDWNTCWQHCLARPNCRTVDYWASWCHLSLVTKIEKEADWRVNPSLGISYNQRDCA